MTGTPLPEPIQQAFEEVYGLPCTPDNFLLARRRLDPQFGEMLDRAKAYLEAERTFPREEAAQ